MNIDYVLSAHGLSGGGFKKEEEVPIPSVENLVISQNGEGTTFNLSWKNSTDVTFDKVEIYTSIVDLANKKYEDVVSVATKLTEGNVQAYTYNSTNHNTIYFFKIYSIYTVFGAKKVDEGKSIFLKAIDSVAPDKVTGLKGKGEDTKITLSWVNPVNSDFSKTTIVSSLNGYPTSKTDGNVVYEGKGNTLTLNDLINDIPYYFSLFTEDVNGNVSESVTITATPSAYKIYGVKIDTLNSNPETAVTYIDDAIGFTKALMGTSTFSYGSWADKFPFNEIKPCVLKNGIVNYYLNPNDYTKKADGTSADITSGNDGDVMVEFPKVYWKFETVGNDLYVRYSSVQVDNGYLPLAHTRGNVVKDKTYISAYLGFELSGKLRSLSGNTPTGSRTIAQFRTLSQANGSGYDQMAYYQVLMLQVLYLVMFKNRDSQSALGQGYTTASTATTTGNTNTKGLFYGEQTGKVQMKFCGVEDFYGNLLYWLDGIVTDTSRNILLSATSFNDAGTGYTSYPSGVSTDSGGYISTVQGGTQTGFIIKGTGGSTTTHYADQGYLYKSKVGCFGGYYSNGAGAGAFRLDLADAASYSSALIGSRLLAL